VQEQFIDICILCGCDYCGTIRGIGPKRALQLIIEHKTLEKVLVFLDKSKYNIPDPFPIEVCSSWASLQSSSTFACVTLDHCLWLLALKTARVRYSILHGCKCCSTIRGTCPNLALRLIVEHKTLKRCLPLWTSSSTTFLTRFLLRCAHPGVSCYSKFPSLHVLYVASVLKDCENTPKI
jgi:5'-3' exonuclease